MQMPSIRLNFKLKDGQETSTKQEGTAGQIHTTTLAEQPKSQSITRCQLKLAFIRHVSGKCFMESTVAGKTHT